MERIVVYLATLLATIFTVFGASMSNEIGPLNLSGDQYWDNPLAYTGDIGMERLSNNIEGMVIDLPPKIFLDERSTIPLICLWTQDKAKARINSLATSTWLVLTHLESGGTDVVKLARSPDVRDRGPISKGWSNEWHEADIKEIAFLGPSLGRYFTWLVCGTMVSNTGIFELYPSRKAEHDKAAKQRIAEIRRGLDDSDSVEGGTSPLVGIAPYHPSEIGKGGLRLSLVSKEKEKPEIRVSFQIEGLEKFLVPPAKWKKDKTGQITYARFPLVLMGFSRENGFAYQQTYLIPVVVKPKGSPDSPLLEGAVNILLNKDPEFLGVPISSIWATTMNHRALLELSPGPKAKGD